MNKLVVIAGPTASGKSGLGIDLALKYNAEIVSADSRQVFKGLDIGSGKVTPEETQGVPHWLLDVAEPNDFFSVKDFQKLAYDAIDDIHSRGVKAFMVGGTGLYVNSVVDGYNLTGKQIDPELRNEVASKSLEELISFLEEKNPEVLKKLDLCNKRRIERAVERVILGNTDEPENTPRYETLVLATNWPREILYDRIKKRLDMRLEEQNMIDEIVKLRENGATDEFLYGLGLEYRYILMYLRKEFDSYEAFYEKLFMEIRHLAKEQMTWFRKRKDIHWLDMTSDPFDEAVILINNFYGECSDIT
ncbi:MAG: tRNA (adenosine(37)-N6)-dimethylallyltransferase MiaA [Oscillospiraceae bacterium]|nr:tRNA (adenosine(37)-N6)-dimethylallyltransferase MiaA [Oscillospiraceae bacterium]